MGRQKQQPSAGARRSALAATIEKKWGGVGREVALDRLVSELGDVQRYDIVAALKELERLGVGEFEVGRAGQRARFLWLTQGGRQEASVKQASAKQTNAKQTSAKQANAKQAGKSGRVPNEAGKPSRGLQAEEAPRGRADKPARKPVGLAPSAASRSEPVAAVRSSQSASSAGATPAPSAALTMSSALLAHSFHLRPSCVAVVSLPADVTRIEVERLCRFLQAIPFEATKDG